jgi:hypothetical protein
MQTYKKLSDEKMECLICNDALEGNEIYPMEGCEDIFHKDCLKEYVN